MDTLRGSFDSLAESDGYDRIEEEDGREGAPLAIGQDDRRMQVRAYNHWASLLGERSIPAIEDLEPQSLPDFGPHSVLLDFTNGSENPGVAYLGDALARECGIADEALELLSEVPPRSLLARITEHYLQILSTQAPIGFEAEFVNQRGATILYRGVLLPFSSDDDTIDFIYGVINWKELADAHASDELLLEIDQALDAGTPESASEDSWADVALPANDTAPGDDDHRRYAADNVLPMPAFGYGEEPVEDEDEDAFVPFGLSGGYTEEDLESEDEEEDEAIAAAYGSLLKMPLDLAKSAEKAAIALPEADEAELAQSDFELADTTFAEDAFSGLEPVLPVQPQPELEPAGMELGDWLAAARQVADAARSNEDRTRTALYEAIGRAYDFSLAAAEAPAEFAELLAAAELTMQDRAPMTPVVKLVFGADYDKTRVTEYAAALHHAHRLELPLGTLGAFLNQHEGGLKGVVKAERRLRKEEAGKVVEQLDTPREALARKLRALPALSLEAIAPDGGEFALVMIRRTPEGAIEVLGEVPDEIALIERAARRLLG